MRRREFIAAFGRAAIVWPLAVRAQQGERVRRVGVLLYSANVGADFQSVRNLLRDDLEQLGWSEGRNVL